MEYLSIVIPCHNSSDKLFPLEEKIRNVMNTRDFEIIFVDDGSRDNTWENISKLSSSSEAVKGIKLGSNLGQQNAVFAGLCFCSGDFAVTMDDDMEHNPEAIPELMERIKKGYDLVYAVSTKKYSLLRKTGSFLHDLMFYFAFRKPFSLKITSFRIIKKDLVNRIIKTRKRYIYISAIALSMKPETDFILTDPVKVSGSRYTLRKLVMLYLSLVINYGLPGFLYRSFLKNLFYSNKETREIISGYIETSCGNIKHEK